MRLEEFTKKNKIKFQSFLESGFTQAQLDEPMRDVLINLYAIVGRYQNGSKPQNWQEAADFIKKHMLDTSDICQAPFKSEYLYRNVRRYIQKDMSRIHDLLKWEAALPPEEKMSELADIISELTLDCVEECVQEFKQEAQKEMQRQQKIAQRIDELKLTMGEKLISKEEKDPEALLKRYEKLQKANKDWWKYDMENVSASEKEGTQLSVSSQSKKRKRSFDENVPIDGNIDLKPSLVLKPCLISESSQQFLPPNKVRKKEVRWENTVTGGDKDGKAYRAKHQKEMEKEKYKYIEEVNKSPIG